MADYHPKAQRTAEKRALGLIMLQAEREGICLPPGELRKLVASLPYSVEEIHRGFELLVSDEGRTVGGTLDLAQLSDGWIAQLLDEDMIFWFGTGGEWRLSEKGWAMSRLFDEYADSSHVWVSLIYRGQNDSEVE